MVNRITAVKAREVLDSRGNPTIEVEVYAGNNMGRAIAPSGASTGVHEALELRDGDPRRYGGRGVLKAIDNVNVKIAKALAGLDCTLQKEIDQTLIELDGTSNKANLGANATVATSMAVAKCAASCKNLPLYLSLNPNAALLPVPMLNVLNGGKHAGTKLSPQEFMIMPIGASNFREALRMASETYHELGNIVKERYGVSAKNVGDEGGYAPNMTYTSEALDCLTKAIENAGYSKEIFLAIDPAASSFYDADKKTYHIDGKDLTAQQLVDFWAQLTETYPIISVEDPFQEEDFDSFSALTKKIGSKIQVVGDDIFVTNVKRIKQGIERQSANSVLIKLNQIGTITETVDAINLAGSHGWTAVVSHRSGETEDTTIADFVVAMGTGQIKTGAPARGERTSKYNQLLRIEEDLEINAKYAGINFRQCGCLIPAT
ncbi:MAG: phosphopyruvate hydratase [Candidatus Bathyarchaeota archaeon]|nr:phosphopyruvate hydratase [Candidatus Bathyarchaeota archaeon]